MCMLFGECWRGQSKQHASFHDSAPFLQYLKKVEKCASKADALKVLASTASSLTLPGDPAWPLGTLITAPKTAVETGACI